MSRDFYRYRTRGQRRVQGWLKPRVLELLSAIDLKQSDLGVNGGVAEIGVHHGKLFIGMDLLRRAGEKSIAIDLFADQAKNVDGSGRGDEEMFRRNLRRHTEGLGVIVQSADSTTIGGRDITEALGMQVRLFSVDGGHTADIVEHDMKTAQDSLAVGGVVVTDDFFNEQWPGVAEGTLRFLASDPDIVPFAIGFNKVLFTTVEHCAAYQAVSVSLANSKRIANKESELFGQRVVVLFDDRPIRRILNRMKVIPGLLPLYRRLKRMR